MPSKSANVKNEKQYEALKDKGMSKEHAAKIANSPDASKHGGEEVPQRQRQGRPGWHDRSAQGRRAQGWQSSRQRTTERPRRHVDR